MMFSYESCLYRYKEEALAVTTDPDQKFDLAMDLKRVDIAHALLLEGTEMYEVKHLG
jgi:hypothetical protein